jgi:hypothetical protein
MLMVKSKQKINKTRKKSIKEEDSSVYFLKLVVFLILGSQWIYIENLPEWQIPIPIGLLLGLILASHEHFQIDRKIEYAILLIASFISFWLPLGLVIQV